MMAHCVNDEFMVLENSQDNAKAVQMSEGCAAKTSDFIKTTPAVFARATVARSTPARILCPMVSPQLLKSQSQSPSPSPFTITIHHPQSQSGHNLNHHHNRNDCL